MAQTGARYLIRMDDACPTMRHAAWSEMEALLDSMGVRPIVGVVPDNADPDLALDARSPGFWDKVRRWQAKGWAIGLHGHRHVFHPIDRTRLLLPFYDRSEFAGLTLEEQSGKIRSAWGIFQREGVRPSVWIAPAHCFDAVTLEALQRETPIRTVSDGLALDQFHAHGFRWLPQQLWALQPRSFGLWTVCLHPSNMGPASLKRFAAQLASPYFRNRVVSVADLAATTRPKGVGDRLFEHYFWNKGRVMQRLARARAAWRRNAP
jgi:predicted deacetylase